MLPISYFFSIECGKDSIEQVLNECEQRNNKLFYQSFVPVSFDDSTIVKSQPKVL